MEDVPTHVLETFTDADAGQIPVYGILEQPDPVTVTRLTPIAYTRPVIHNIGDQWIPTYSHIIAPLHFCDPDVSFEDPTPPGWVNFTHPEGSIYWYNSALQLVTDVNVSSQEMLHNVLLALEMFRERLGNLPLDKVAPQLRANRGADEWHLGMNQWELFLGMNPRDPREFQYCVADWEKECLFWVEDNTLHPLTSTQLWLDPPTRYEHLRLMLRYHFWLHVESFPAHRPLPEGSFNLLRTVLLYSANDRMTSARSTVRYPTKDLRRVIQMLPEKQSEDPSCAPYIAAIAARHWTEIWSNRIHNLHGLPNARLSQFEGRGFRSTTHQSITRRAKLICWILFFNQPKTFYCKLCDVWDDQSVDQWRSLLGGMHEEWTNTSFMATVTLATNMSFLSIDKLNSVDVPLVSQTASVVSIILAIGSIVSGMLLVQRHRKFDTDTCIDGAEEASDYFITCAYYSPTGLLGAACLFSAPRALFLWSLLLFVSGLLSFSFSKASRTFTPYIAVATAMITLIILAQIGYFSCHSYKPAPAKRSPWSQTDSDMPKRVTRRVPAKKKPWTAAGVRNLWGLFRARAVGPENPAQGSPWSTISVTDYPSATNAESPSTATDIERPPAIAAPGAHRGDTPPTSQWRRLLLRLFSGPAQHPISDIERGDAALPQLPILDFGDSAPFSHAMPFMALETQQRATAPRGSLTSSARCADRGPRNVSDRLAARDWSQPLHSGAGQGTAAE